jgi:lipopolysaccharide/colanic/teichoic acid biosynthesis glycosyltransferase
MATHTDDLLLDDTRLSETTVPFVVGPDVGYESDWQDPGSTSTTRIRKPTGPADSIVDRRMAAGQPFVEPQGNLTRGYLVWKRLFDVVGTLCLLLFLAPVILTTFLVLMVTTRGRPLFWQDRMGYLGRPFRMCKFRTMHSGAAAMRHKIRNEKDGPIFKNRRDPRITRIGRFLRKTSIDETPQLLNVLLGQMSLVGPRPIAANEAAHFEPWHRSRLAVMPGLTCLWQVSGRSEVGFEDWMRMDIRYVRNQSMKTDLWLLLKTPLSVLSGRGAY